MLALPLTGAHGGPLRVLCLGAHPDDIEIGCGGTVLRLAGVPAVEFTWVVLSGDATRAEEAACGASAFLTGISHADVVVKGFRDGFFPYEGAEIKGYFEELKQTVTPDLIFTHYRADRHQDHRVVSELTWNTFRDHLILEYEIPKWDGDLGAPNCYVDLDRATCQGKIAHLLTTFRSQRAKRWFTAETFQGLMRLRGVEAGAPGGYAEAFYAHKLVCSP
ncbi:MAG TPA: PIG-L deacetylase family protein [Solirubrobacteraceae bacterium]|nr:PIG-L deacetylase family protein [Solirubrobacteraceae bacterium]